MQSFVFSIVTLLACTQVLAGESVREVVSGVADREAMAITVYNDDLALVKERRRLDLPGGLTRLSLREVSARMRPETALLRATEGPAIRLVEQNFDFDLLTPAKLLEKYVGHEVTVIRTHPVTGVEQREQATVLSASSGVVLRFADRIETGAPGRIAYDSVPDNLRDRPTLSILLEGSKGPRSLELSYLTSGISWAADYVANLSLDGRQMDLSGWVTLTNRSGAAYTQATLQLVAGTVNRVQPQLLEQRDMLAAAPMARKVAVAQESLLDYHLYSFEAPTSIADNQTKQLALLSAGGISVQREYLLAGNDWYYQDEYGQIGQKLKPAVFVEFRNQGGDLGKPLPAGVVRVYARDSRGAAQFVGEDRIAHTAKNEVVRLKLGEAFDITADRRQTAFRRVGKNVTEASYRVELRNAKSDGVSVTVQEPLPGDWEVLRESHPHSKEAAHEALWKVPVPAEGLTVLDYTVRVKW